MATATNYPPYQVPIVDVRTARVSTVWQRFFLSLVGAADVAGVIRPGSLPLDTLETIAAPGVLGRGSAGTGPVEPLTVGAGLAITGTTLAVDPATLEPLGYWTPITDGVTPIAELLFDTNGDCIVGFVPTPV